MFKFVFVLQVIAGPLAVVSCDCYTMSVVFTKNKNSELLRLINPVSQKGKRNSMTDIHENSVRLWNASKVSVFKYINIKKTMVC